MHWNVETKLHQIVGTESTNERGIKLEDQNKKTSKKQTYTEMCINELNITRPKCNWLRIRVINLDERVKKQSDRKKTENPKKSVQAILSERRNAKPE